MNNYNSTVSVDQALTANRMAFDRVMLLNEMAQAVLPCGKGSTVGFGFFFWFVLARCCLSLENRQMHI